MSQIAALLFAKARSAPVTLVRVEAAVTNRPPRPRALAEPRASVPSVSVVVLKVLVPESVTVPAPALIKAPPPMMLPA